MDRGVSDRAGQPANTQVIIYRGGPKPPRLDRGPMTATLAEQFLQAISVSKYRQREQPHMRYVSARCSTLSRYHN